MLIFARTFVRESGQNIHHWKTMSTFLNDIPDEFKIL